MTNEPPTGERRRDEPEQGRSDATGHPTRPPRSFDAWLIVVAAAVPTVAIFAARLHWSLDLWTAFPLHAAIGSLLAGGAAALFRNRAAAVLSVAVGVIALGLFWSAKGRGPVAGSAANSADGSESLSILSANVLTRNANHAAFVEQIRADPPDIVVAVEVDRGWVRSLDELSDLYPHRIPLPRGDNFGMMLLSRQPWTRYDVVAFDESDDEAVPSLVVDLVHADQPLTLIATHPLPPIGHGNWTSRNAQLAGLAKYVAGLDTPAIVAGDLNLPPWSPFYDDLLETSGLRDGRMAAAGWSGTWRSDRWWMRTPIDYILHTPDLVATRYTTQHINGSDHRAVRATLAVRSRRR